MRVFYLFISCIFFLQISSVYGQTNTFPNSGNVGIGTTSPQYVLHSISQNNTSSASSFLYGDYYGSAVGIHSTSAIYYAFEVLSGVNTVGGGGSTLFSVMGNGCVGIGTNAPQYDLQINGQNPSLSLTSSNSTAPSAALRGNNSTWVLGYGGAAGQEDISLGTQDNTGARTITFAAGGSGKMKILANGFVGIGTLSPKEQLSVNGNIRAKQVKVELANWPDYVFFPNYKLNSLSELEQYIKTNQHLPEIPSAKEVEKEGINLGEINTKLLKKIEELTLALIEQNRLMQQQNMELQKRIKTIEDNPAIRK